MDESRLQCHTDDHWWEDSLHYSGTTKMKLEATDCTQICLRSLARSSESRWVSVHSIQVDSGFPVKQRHTYLTSLEREFRWENNHIIWEMIEWNTERFWIENWNKVIYDGTLKSGVVWMAPVIKADHPFEQQKENSMTSQWFYWHFWNSMTFHWLSRPFQNSLTFQVFHDRYEPCECGMVHVLAVDGALSISLLQALELNIGVENWWKNEIKF